MNIVLLSPTILTSVYYCLIDAHSLCLYRAMYNRCQSEHSLCVCIYRCVTFHPDGHSLFSGAQDSMRVYGWEPVRCYDSFSLGWGKVADIAISSSQLVSDNNNRCYVH